MTVMVDFNAQVGKQANPARTATAKFGQQMKIVGGNTFVTWETLRQYKTMFQKNVWR